MIFSAPVRGDSSGQFEEGQFAPLDFRRFCTVLGFFERPLELNFLMYWIDRPGYY